MDREPRLSVEVLATTKEHILPPREVQSRTEELNDALDEFYNTVKEASSKNLLLSPDEVRSIFIEKVNPVLKKKFKSVSKIIKKIFSSEEGLYLEDDWGRKIFFHPISDHKFGPFDKKTFEIISKTQAMMFFPSPKDRSLRARLEKMPSVTLGVTYYKKISERVVKQHIRSSSVGMVFKVQCEHWCDAQKKRSLNVIMAATEKGIFNSWVKLGYNIGLARKYMGEFKRVRHLLAANLALTGTDIQTYPEASKAGFFDLPLASFYLSPARFFLTADKFRTWALDAGFIGRKTELWMPEGWRELVRGYPEIKIGKFCPLYLEGIKMFDEIEKEYKKNKEYL